MQYQQQRERGSALLEFALILPVFLALLLGIVDLGQGFNRYLGLLNATREGTLWLARHPADLDGMNVRIAGELARIELTVEAVTVLRIPEKSAYAAGDLVTVRIEYEHQVLFGAITGIPALTLQTEQTARVQ